LTAGDIYQQCIDKQRVVVTGKGSRIIALLIVHVLKYHNRKFDYILENQESVIHKDSPTIIIQGPTLSLDYNHHIGVISAPGSDLDQLDKFADATPKGGTLIYAENDPKIKIIGSKERTDIQGIPYISFKHEEQNGKTFLVSGSNEKIPVRISGALFLECASAAKEVLKKLGITSGQFYKAVGDFELP
jgi:UDP-N-acetylmuramate: L-alanyl-gamma-D-glutamyl-meso-diaminopimelate ligase